MAGELTRQAEALPTERCKGGSGADRERKVSANGDGKRSPGRGKVHCTPSTTLYHTSVVERT